jgi:DNA-directed RNA polymerase beta' subunit
LRESGISRAIKGIKERLTGKTGLIRFNMMGKRVEESARTVISPDPNLKFGQVGVPRDIAKILSVPVRIASYNIESMTKLVNDEKANEVIKPDGTVITCEYAINKKGTTINFGDIIIREKRGGGGMIEINAMKTVLKIGDQLKRNGEFIDVVYPEKRLIVLEIGDVVKRQLKDGDIVLLNRQPTLHKGSMMGMEVVVMNSKTFRFNLSITKSLNADFDFKPVFALIFPLIR